MAKRKAQELTYEMFEHARIGTVVHGHRVADFFMTNVFGEADLPRPAASSLWPDLYSYDVVGSFLGPSPGWIAQEKTRDEEFIAFVADKNMSKQGITDYKILKMRRRSTMLVKVVVPVSG